MKKAQKGTKRRNRTGVWDDDFDALLDDLANWDIGDLLDGMDVDFDALLADLASYDLLPIGDIDFDALLEGLDVDLDAMLTDLQHFQCK